MENNGGRHPLSTSGLHMDILHVDVHSTRVYSQTCKYAFSVSPSPPKQTHTDRQRQRKTDRETERQKKSISDRGKPEEFVNRLTLGEQIKGKFQIHMK